jgi:hypothetical protein
MNSDGHRTRTLPLIVVLGIITAFDAMAIDLIRRCVRKWSRPPRPTHRARKIHPGPTDGPEQGTPVDSGLCRGPPAASDRLEQFGRQALRPMVHAVVVVIRSRIFCCRLQDRRLAYYGDGHFAGGTILVRPSRHVHENPRNRREAEDKPDGLTASESPLALRIRVRLLPQRQPNRHPRHIEALA